MSASAGASGLQRHIFRRGSVTYFNSSVFFPDSVRRETEILYGFVRTADDFVDSVPQDREGFFAFRELYRAALAGRPAGDPVIDSFVGLSAIRGFDRSWAEAFFMSMELDLKKRIYRTIDETLEYVYGSAEVIGLFMAKILGLPDEAETSARMLGRAMQFINFIRDVEEDNSLGRIYLPLSETSLPDLRRESVEENPDEFRFFIRRQVERFEAWQKEAEEGYRLIPGRLLVPIKTAADMYLWTGRRIAKNPLIVFRKKLKPSKARVLGHALLLAVGGARQGQ
jgi:15-cis-phytoene synthase